MCASQKVGIGAAERGFSMAPWREIKEREPGESTATHKNTERRRNSDSSFYEVGDTILRPSEDFWSCSIFQVRST